MLGFSFSISGTVAGVGGAGGWEGDADNRAAGSLVGCPRIPRRWGGNNQESSSEPRWFDDLQTIIGLANSNPGTFAHPMTFAHRMSKRGEVTNDSAY
jgi:hypothetical protein